MTLPEFGDLLAGTYPNSYHYAAGAQDGNYAVWQEYGGTRQKSGPLAIRKIQVDIFTRTEFDPALEEIVAALDAAGVKSRAPKTTYEHDTGYTHHILLCEVLDRG